MRDTTYESAVAHFTRSAGGASELAAWRNRPGKAPVEQFAKTLVTRHLYEVTPGQVESVCAETRHALEWPGGQRLNRSTAESVPLIADWYPNYPLVHTLYFAVEVLGRPPLWDELIEFWRSNQQASLMLGRPAARQVKAAIEQGGSQADVEEAMWWRLGNAYYSLLREIYVLASLRELGLDVQYHVIADALFRADFWVEDTIISLFVANDRYRGKRTGRKRQPQEILGDWPGFRFAAMPRMTRREYGTVHLPSREEIELFAAEELGIPG